jgi:hypothetical protein
MWKWDDTLDDKWARVAMCSQMLNIPIDMPEDIKEERRGTSWARATRELRRLRHRIEAVGGSKDQWEAGVWHMDKEQWNLLWTGEQAFWKAVPHLMAAGHRTAEALTEPRKLDTGRPYKIPQLMAAQEGERTQLMRILVSRGIGGIDERTRGLTQRWFDMVDWRSAQVGSARLGVSRSIEGYTRKLEGEVNVHHPARIWVERQENKSVVNEPERLPTTSECGRHLLRIIEGLKQGTGTAVEEASWRTADPSRYPQQVCRGLAQLLSCAQVNSEEAQWLAKQVGSRLPPGWGATWTERGCGELEGTLTDQRQLVVSYLRAMEVGCAKCQVRYMGTCQQCQLKWCTLCQQDKEECDVCGVPLTLTADLGASGVKASTQRPAKRLRDAEVTIVNMHRLGESFVENFYLHRP